MRNLHDMNIGQRAMVTVVVVVLIMLVLALIGYISGRWEDAQAQAVVTISKWESHLLELDKQALDKAYMQQIGHIFDIWIKDGVEDPSRATRGFINARKGYNLGMIKIEERQQRLQQ